MSQIEYKGFVITCEPKPIPTTAFDWSFYHPQNGDGGTGSSVEDCKQQIDEIEDHIAGGCPDPTGEK